MHPFVLQHDPNSGDYGLAFFGATMNHGAYLVQSPKLGWLCYLCDLTVGGGLAGTPPVSGEASLVPRDAYRRRIYLDPLGLELQALAGTFESAVVNFGHRTVTVVFTGDIAGLLSAFRLVVESTG